VTYCLGVAVDEGLLMVADTRTNAGIDNVSSYRKLHALADTPERQVHLACSGSLSVSQTILHRLTATALAGASSLFEVAEVVGALLGRENGLLKAALGPDKPCGASLLLGGRIGDEKPRLFHIYVEGNFIECRPDLPYLQIGETKYGRPILDRVITRRTPLAAAVKVAFLSFDSAMRSNLSVSKPLDLMILPAAAQNAQLLRIDQDDAYFNELSRRWSAALLEAATVMPDPYFMDEGRSCPLPRQVTALRAC
jgi:putative proteasome-type protease